MKKIQASEIKIGMQSPDGCAENSYIKWALGAIICKYNVQIVLNPDDECLFLKNEEVEDCDILDFLAEIDYESVKEISINDGVMCISKRGGQDDTN